MPWKLFRWLAFKANPNGRSARSSERSINSAIEQRRVKDYAFEWNAGGPNSSGGVFDEFKDTVLVTFICPISRQLMKDPVVDREGNSYDRASIETWLNSGNNTSPLTLQPLRQSDLATNRALRDAIDEFVKEIGGLRNVSLPVSDPMIQGPPINWKDSQLARSKAFRAVAFKLSIFELSPEQEQQIATAFSSVQLRDEAAWHPELDSLAALRSAVARVRWGVDRVHRLFVYGEFAQWLRPHVSFSSLGHLELAVKADAQAAYLASALKPHLATDLDVIRDALDDLSRAYGR
jgi:hypothetical protein